MAIIANFGGAGAHAVQRPKTCTRCPLHEVAKYNCVPSRGAEHPHVMLVGEAPGPDEDRQGLPFVGRSGVSLDEMLFSPEPVGAAFHRNSIRWSNVVRCFPGRDVQQNILSPTPDQIKMCSGSHLLMEIALQQPQLLVALGKTASVTLTGNRSAIDRMRGFRNEFRFPDYFIEWAEKALGLCLYEGIPEKTQGIPPQRWDAKTCRSVVYPVVVTYHPAAALRPKGASIKGQIIADLIYARKIVYQEPRLTNVDYRVVQSVDELNQWADFFIASWRAGAFPFLSFDLETGISVEGDDSRALLAFDPQTEIVSIQISWAERHAILIPVSHPDGSFANTFGIAAIRNFLKRIFVDEAVPAGGQNLKFDYKYLWSKFGIKLANVAFDSRYAHQCLYAGSEPNDLDYIAAKYAGMQGYGDGLKERMSKLPAGRKQFQNVPLDQAYIDYACGDVDAVFRAAPKMFAELQSQNLLDTYREVYLKPFIPICEMEINGLPVDMQVYEWLKYDMPQHLDEIISRIRQTSIYPAYLVHIGCPIEHIPGLVAGDAPKHIKKKFDLNPGSTKQKVKLLFDVMQLPKNPEYVSDKTGEQSTDKKAMAELRDTCAVNKWHEHLIVVEAIQEYALLDKLHSAYIKNLPDVVPYRDQPPHELFVHYTPPTLIPWSAHPNINLDGTQTGRVSASEPAIHNMPGKSAVKRLFRSRWRDRGGLHLQFDYSAMEVRVLACRAMADDPTLKHAFAHGFDAHKFVASIIFKKPMEDVTPKERKICKTVNFAVLYGSGPANVAGLVGITVPQAEKFIAEYLGALPRVATWKTGQETFALMNGYVKSAFGRIRYLSTKLYSRGDIERRAVNTPIQSTASDITLTTYCRLHPQLPQNGFQTLPYLFIHDSLGFDVYPGEYFDVWELIQYEMAVMPPNIYPWIDLPLAVESDTGYTWGAMTSVQRLDRNNWKFTASKEDHGRAVMYQLGLAGHQFNYSTYPEVVDGENVTAFYLQVNR